MATYAERYAADEVCNEGHDKKSGEPCYECQENELPHVLRTPLPAPPEPVRSIMPISDFLAEKRERQEPVFATCQMDSPPREPDKT